MLDSTQRALQDALESFVIGSSDEPVGFVRRLARENAWSESHARDVTREYLRFVFLCAESGHPCTPSDAVDQAWHLHLVYTWSYWNELVPLLPFPLHHGPTKGGSAEDEKHHDWYARTLASYDRLFGEKPPAAIWPATFEPEDETVRLCRADYWLIPRRSLRLAALVGVAALTGGCAIESSGAAPFAFLAFTIFLVMLLRPPRTNASRKRSPGRRVSDDSGCGSDASVGLDASHHDGGGGHHGDHGCGGHGGHGCGGHGCGGHGCGSH